MHKWATNIEHTARLADAVSRMCGIAEEDYAHYAEHRAGNIQDADVRDAVRNYSADFGNACRDIEAGIVAHRANRDVPESCRISKLDLSVHRLAWQKHVMGERQTLLLEHFASCTAQLRDDILTKMDAMWKEDDGVYSSYSDYSDDDTDSETDENDNDNGDGGERTKPHKVEHQKRQRKNDDGAPSSKDKGD